MAKNIIKWLVKYIYNQYNKIKRRAVTMIQKVSIGQI